VKYQLIEAYEPDSFAETEEGLLLEIGVTNSNYVRSWLLGFGGKVKVLEPDYIAKEVQAAAAHILERYK